MQNMTLSPDRFLGAVVVETSGQGIIIVRDGLGGEVSIPPSSHKAFAVQLDRAGCLYFRCSQQDRAGIPVVEKAQVSWRETNYVQVSRDRSQEITWACYERAKAPTLMDASPVPSATPVMSMVAEVARSVQPAGSPVPSGGGVGGAFGFGVGVGVGPSQTPSGMRETQTPRVPQTPGGPSIGHNFSSRSEVFDTAKEITSNFLQYVEQAPRRLSKMCFGGGIAVILIGCFSLLDIFQVFDHAIYYTIHAYMVFFGLVTCVTELHDDILPDLYKSMIGVQAWMHEWAKGLTTLWGRGLFNLFQGALALSSSGPLGLGVLVGIYMMIMGLAYLYLHHHSPGQPRQQDSLDGYVMVNS